MTEDNVCKPGLKQQQQQISKKVPFQTDPSSSPQSIYTLKGDKPPKYKCSEKKTMQEKGQEGNSD